MGLSGHKLSGSAFPPSVSSAIPLTCGSKCTRARAVLLNLAGLMKFGPSVSLKNPGVEPAPVLLIGVVWQPPVRAVGFEYTLTNCEKSPANIAGVGTTTALSVGADLPFVY